MQQKNQIQHQCHSVKLTDLCSCLHVAPQRYLMSATSFLSLLDKTFSTYQLSVLCFKLHMTSINYCKPINLFAYLYIQLISKLRQSNFRGTMEPTGMFNQTISSLTNFIYQHANVKAYSQIFSKSLSLGLPIREDYSPERIIFTLSQIIINLIDEIVLRERAYRLQQSQRRMWERDNGIQDGLVIEANSTLKSTPPCYAGNLNIAALIFSIFCPKVGIWDILQYLTNVKDQLQKEDAILQNIRLENRIFYLPNLRNSYNCHCSIFSTEYKVHQTLQCLICSNKYHAECQANIIYCNSCFLRFCVLDLKEQINDPFNLSKEIELYYFSYIQNCYNYDYDPKNDCVYFHLAKFDLPELNNIQKKDKYVHIKLSLVNKIYNSEINLSLNRKKVKKDIKQFWDVDNFQYYFYLNHNELRINNSISDCAIIFKVLARMMTPANNILAIKCVKKCFTYNYSSIVPYWSQPDHQNKVIMIGVYQINKVKGQQKRKKQYKENKNILQQIKIPQSILFLQFTLKKINQIEFQIVDLIDVISKKKIINPVRSFGCTHVQCFDFDQFKKKIKPPSLKTKLIKKDETIRSFSIDLDQKAQSAEDQVDVIQLDSNSVEIVEVKSFSKSNVEVKPLSYSLMTPEQRKKAFSRKKRLKTKKEKQEKQNLHCPICSKKMISLYMDPLFQQILINSGFYTKVKIYSNGQFNFEGLPKS